MCSNVDVGLELGCGVGAVTPELACKGCDAAVGMRDLQVVLRTSGVWECHGHTCRMFAYGAESCAFDLYVTCTHAALLSGLVVMKCPVVMRWSLAILYLRCCNGIHCQCCERRYTEMRAKALKV